MATSPSVRNYVTGGANVYFAAWDDVDTPPTLPGDWLHVGNCPSFATEPNFEKLLHNSSMVAAYEQDDSRIIQKKMSLKLKLDEITPENLAYFFSGTLDDPNTVNLMAADTVYVAVKLEKADADNPWEIGIHKMEISGSGAMEWINMGAYGELELEGEVLSDYANHPTQRFGYATLGS